MKLSNLAQLRMQLRTINMEYSALVRKRVGDQSRVARMAVLNTKRAALMAFIMQQRTRETMRIARDWPITAHVPAA